jgi:hypothetical protein
MGLIRSERRQKNVGRKGGDLRKNYWIRRKHNSIFSFVCIDLCELSRLFR